MWPVQAAYSLSPNPGRLTITIDSPVSVYPHHAWAAQRVGRDAGGRLMPFSTAHAASCVRDANPSFASALAT